MRAFPCVSVKVLSQVCRLLEPEKARMNENEVGEYRIFAWVWLREVIKHTSKKQKSLRILLFRPKNSAEKVHKSSRQNIATKVRKSFKFNDL